MGFVRALLLVLHILTLVGLLVMSVAAARRRAPRLPPGMLHAALTMLVTGIALIGVSYPLGRDVNNARAGLKTVILLVILGLVLSSRRRDPVQSSVYGAVGGLTLLNTVIALVWQ